MKKIKKAVCSTVAGLILLSSTPYLGFAEEAFISPWARLEILDAERYGIYSSKWHDENFRQEISEEKVQEILKNLEEKLVSMGLEERSDFQAVDLENNLTRGDFLRNIYNLTGKYDKESEMDPILYLNKLGLIRGNGVDLNLKGKITTEEAVLFSKRTIDIFFNKFDKASKGLLWESEKNGNKVYMLGSIHLADSSIYPFSDRIMNRFKDSDKLFVEVDISDSEKSAEAMAKKMEEIGKKTQYTEGRNLRDDLGQDLFNKLKSFMDKHEVNEEDYINNKPAAIIPQITTLSLLSDLAESYNGQEVKENPEISDENMEEILKNLEEAAQEDPSKYGVDMYLILRAKEMNMPVGELESLDFQLDMLFDSIFKNPYIDLDLEEQISILEKELDKALNPEREQPKEDLSQLDGELKNQVEEFQNQLEAMLEAWKNADAQALKTIFLESSQEEIQTKLLGERDKNMAKKISELLENGENKTYFVVVGAAHYVSDGMTIDNLKSMGYQVKSLNIN